MRIYSVSPKDEVQRLETAVDLGVKILRHLGLAQPWVRDWQSPKTWRMQKPHQRKLAVLSDWTAVGPTLGMPALSAKAKALVEPMLGSMAQWLPLSFDEREYWLLNCMNVPDVLDMQASSITYRADGSIWNIDAFAFKPIAVAEELLFKVLGAPNSMFATNRFRELAEQSGLTGIFYQPVWDSDHAPFKPIPGRGGEILTRPEVYGPEGFVPNVQELWPPEWKERAREMKRNAADDIKTSH